MPFVTSIIDDAIKAALIGNPGVYQAVQKRVFDGVAEPGSPAPFIVFQQIAGGYTNDSPIDNVDVDYQIMAWDTDSTGAYALLEQVIETFNNKQFLALVGWSCYWLSPGKLISRTDFNEGQKYFGRGTTLTIKADKLPRDIS